MNLITTLQRTLPLSLAITLAVAQSATAGNFVYEGRLDDRSQPANGRYDIQLAPYTTEKQGSALAPAITFEQVDVRDGRFRIDFDLPLSAADSAWLEIAVRAGDEGTTFSTIPGRTKAIAAPLVGACWSTVGDSGVIAATNFLGTTDAQPINIRANGVQGWSMTGGTDGYVNIIGGGPGLIVPNPPQVLSGAQGAFIGNGGKRLAGLAGGLVEGNRVSDHNGVIAGGYGNLAGNLDANPDNSAYATVGGGQSNRARAAYATISGGGGNVALGFGSMVPGGGSACAGGDYSFAAGLRAQVVAPFGSTDPACTASTITSDTNGHEGSFIWADAQPGNFITTGPNQFLMRASGGLGVNTAAIPAGTDMVLASRDGSNTDLLMRPADASNGINFGVVSNPAGAALFISRLNAGVFTDYALWDTDGRLRVFFDNPIKPTAGGWAAPSDARLKHHIEALPFGTLDRLLSLRGVTFEYNTDAPKNYFVPGVHTGFVAQSVEKVFPDWVSFDESGFKLVAPKGFEALAVEALRELRVEKDAQIEMLASENTTLKARLTAIETQLGITH
jgi:trimeric autotransporter adhesin